MNFESEASKCEQSNESTMFLWEQYRALRAEVIQRQTSDAAFEVTAVIGIATFYGWIFSRPSDVTVTNLAFWVPTVVAIFIALRIWHSTQWFNNYAEFSRNLEKHLCESNRDMCWEWYLSTSASVARNDRIRKFTDIGFWFAIAVSGPYMSCLNT
jgi:hypothetical protein